MARRALKLTKTMIEQTAVERNTFFFDSAVPGLAVMVYPSGRATFYFFYRMGRGRACLHKKAYIGPFGRFTVEMAREAAKRMQALVVSGVDPAVGPAKPPAKPGEPPQATVAEAMETFGAMYVSGLKPNTRGSYDNIMRLHLLPAFGELPVGGVTEAAVSKFHYGMRSTPYQANRCLAVLSKFYSWAGRNGLAPKGYNPTRDVPKYKEARREEYLGRAQIAAICSAIAALEGRPETSAKGCVSGIPRDMADAIRLLVLTGCRKMEVLAMRWEYVSANPDGSGYADLPDTKTGARRVYLPAEAMVVLGTVKARHGEGEWVFPGNEEGHLRRDSLKKPWARVLAEAKVEGRWRIHDLRHAYASIAINSGVSMQAVAALLGHHRQVTTQRYVHVEDEFRDGGGKATAAILSGLGVLAKDEERGK